MKEKFDKRLIERRLRQGLITREEYDAYLDNLPDATKNASVIEARLTTKEEEGDDQQEDDGD